MPKVACDLEPSRALTKKHSMWNWSRECDEALNAEKRKVTNTPVLAYFGPEKEIMLQVDSSKDGLGAAIRQGGRPTEFASRALTQAEQKWAQIEKDTLSLVFGLRRFDQYTYGRKVHIQNDHKPLATYLEETAQPSIPPYPVTDDEVAQTRRDLPVCTRQPTLHCRPPESCFFFLFFSFLLLPNPGIDVRMIGMNSLLDIPDTTRQHRRSVKQHKKILFYRQPFNSLTKDGQPGEVMFLNSSVCTLTSVTRRVVRMESSRKGRES